EHDVAADGLGADLHHRGVRVRSLLLRRVGQVELGARRPTDGVRVDVHARAAANADVDVTGDRRRLDGSAEDRFEALVSGNGVGVDGRGCVADPEVAGDELRHHVGAGALQGDVAGRGLDLRLPADLLDRHVAARRLDTK